MISKLVGVTLVLVGIAFVVVGVMLSGDVKVRFGGHTSTIVDLLLGGAILYITGAMILISNRKRKRRTSSPN